jgi:hypothetical protein
LAYLIPDNLRGDKSVPAAHRRVVTALAPGLDDFVTVWYEPPFDPHGDRPHFVVLDPTLGIAVLVVLDQQDPTKERLLGVWNQALRVDDRGTERDIENPMDRAERFVETLRDSLATRTSLPAIPVVAIAALPHVTRAHAESLDLGTALDLDRVLFKEDLDAAIQDETVLPRKLSQMLEGGLQVELDGPAIDEVRAVIHPDVIISAPDSSVAAEGSLFSAASLGDDDVVKVMDRQQERLAKGLGTGHRVIRGVAGSGKTLVLVHRARTMARLLPNKKILVTCFTRSLASQLQGQLSEFPNIEVVHLNSLMSKVIRSAGLEDPSAKGNWDAVPKVALEALSLRSGQRYRAVMVDEAQDFATEALQFCVELLEATDTADQDLVIVADSAQNIFRRQFRWKDAGINAQGRTRILRVNYRNTREILRFAHDFLTADPTIAVDDTSDPEDEVTIIPAESSERSGPDPTVRLTADASSEIAAVVEMVRGWYSPSLRPRSIAVLLGEQAAGRGEGIVTGLEAAGIPVFWVTDPGETSNRDRAGSVDEPVIVSTIHSAKGLEFERVVVAGLGGRTNDLVSSRKTLYVGFTRAIEELAVVTVKDNVFAPDLSASSDAISETLVS